MSRKILSYNEFESLLGKDVLNNYNDCVIKGFNDHLELIKFNAGLDCYVDLDITTRAKFTHNRICGRLKETFKSHPSVRVDTIRQIIMLNVSDEVLIRQKKFNPKGGISSYPTPSHKKFMSQGEIPGFPAAPTFIVGGYMMNKANTEMLGVYFACYSASGVEWFTKYGEYVHEQQKIDFNAPIVKPIERKLTEVKKKLTKLKIVEGGLQKTINGKTEG